MLVRRPDDKAKSFGPSAGPKWKVRVPVQYLENVGSETADDLSNSKAKKKKKNTIWNNKLICFE